MDVLHVVVLFERITQSQHLARHGLVPDRDCTIRNKRKPLPIGTDACILERFSYGVELIVGSGDNILILLDCQLLRAGFESDFEQSILVNTRARNRDLSFSVKHVRDAAARGEVAAVLGKNSAYFRSGAVSIVCRGLYNDGDAARRITFIRYLIELFTVLAFACAAFDRAVDIVAWHALGASRQNSAAQTWVAVRIPAAGFCREGDFLR